MHPEDPETVTGAVASLVSDSMNRFVSDVDRTFVRVAAGVLLLSFVPDVALLAIDPAATSLSVEVLREVTIDGTPLGDVMFGEIRRYRGGGEVHMDIMFDGFEVRFPGRSDPITMGVTSGYDFLGEHAVYVEGFVFSTLVDINRLPFFVPLEVHRGRDYGDSLPRSRPRV